MRICRTLEYPYRQSGFSLPQGHTNNNDGDILAWIALHGLAEPTSRYGCSGYCRYPEYRFRPEILQELDPDGYLEYLHGYGKRYGKELKRAERIA